MIRPVFGAGDGSVISQATEKEFSIYPNPVHNYIKLQYRDKIPSQNLFSIYNLNGQLLRSFEYDTNEYHNDMQIDVKNLSPGTYIIKDEFGSYCKFTKY